MSEPDISVEAVERAIEAFNAFPSYATISEAGRIVDQLPPLLRALRSSLTAAEKLLRNVHLAEDGESLYSTGDDAHWIKLRDELLGGK